MYVRPSIPRPSPITPPRLLCPLPPCNQAAHAARSPGFATTAVNHHHHHAKVKEENMPETEQMLPPPVQWAQRKNVIFLTICLEDCKDPIIKLETDKLYFKGKGGSDQKDYEVTLEFFKDVNTEESKFVARDRLIEFVLRKKEDGPFWQRLLKDDKKFHWLKVDFNKWRDEDDSDDDAEGNADLEEMMRQMGGLGGGGDKPNLGDLDAGEEEDSDDEGNNGSTEAHAAV